MAGKAKSYYVTVSDVEQKHKTVITKMFFDVKAANEYIKKIVEDYPKPRYTTSRECY